MDSRFEGERCSRCHGVDCEKKLGGLYWHKKCLREMRRLGRKAI
jgi:hypothetical protein